MRLRLLNKHRNRWYTKSKFSNFLVYYWINKVESRVYVTAVIYDRRDQLEQLKTMKIQFGDP